jgi:hypothetical protein
LVNLDAFTVLRLQRGIEHLYRPNPRATAGFLTDIADHFGDMRAILLRLAEYEQRITLGMLRTGGGDRFPWRRPLLVPPR